MTMGKSAQNFYLVITFDWRVLLTLDQRIWTAFCKILSGTPHLTILGAPIYAHIAPHIANSMVTNTGNHWLVQLGRFGLAGLVWQVWFGRLLWLVWFGRLYLQRRRRFNHYYPHWGWLPVSCPIIVLLNSIERNLPLEPRKVNSRVCISFSTISTLLRT